jgi:hypothetical protein
LTAVLHSEYRIDDGFAEIFPEKGIIVYTGKQLPFLKKGEKVEVECVDIQKITGEVIKTTEDSISVAIKSAEIFSNASESSELPNIPCEIKGKIRNVECNITHISLGMIKFISPVIEKDKFTVKVLWQGKKLSIKSKILPVSLLFGQNAKYECEICEINNRSLMLDLISYYHKIWLSEYLEK